MSAPPSSASPPPSSPSLLRQLRLRRGLTQEEVGRAAGITGIAVYYIETMQHRPYPRTLRGVLLALRPSPTEALQIVQEVALGEGVTVASLLAEDTSSSDAA